MRHRVFIACLIVLPLLALPAIALAASRFYRGPVGNGANNADIEITAKLATSRPHRPTKLTRIEWANVPVSCGRFGRGATSDFFPKSVPVNAGSFSSTAKLHGGQRLAELEGEAAGEVGAATCARETFRLAIRGARFESRRRLTSKR